MLAHTPLPEKTACNWHQLEFGDERDVAKNRHDHRHQYPRALENCPLHRQFDRSKNSTMHNHLRLSMAFSKIRHIGILGMQNNFFG